MEKLLRKLLLKHLTGEREMTFTRAVPTREQIDAKMNDIPELGLYLHIPFCEQICPYCPYNKEIYTDDLARRYVHAVKREMDIYADMVSGKPVTSFYIGGGTPTTMLHSGLADMIGHARKKFNLQCDIHLESHPNHLSTENLDAISALGVEHLSIGVEALIDKYLKTLHRPYTVAKVKEAVGRAVAQGFKCVNVDVMFALPEQTCGEIESTGHELVKLGVDQVAAYPLFHFPYTPFGKVEKTRNHVIPQSLKRRRMLKVLERIFYQAGYERSSAWAFTKTGIPRYCSVTVPLYVGLGASGGSYLNDIFYLNTFSAREYINAMEQNGLAIALSLGLTERMQRAGWMYWRIYETRFSKSAYRARFGEEIEHSFGKHLWAMKRLGFLNNDGDRVVLSDRGSFWLHACEDIMSIDYIGKLWGASKQEIWPENVSL